jgi:hypothetical protein
MVAQLRNESLFHIYALEQWRLMSFLKSMFHAAAGQPPVPLRDTLFGDMSLNQWAGNGSISQAFPWSAFVAARAHIGNGDRDAAIRNWYEIINRPGLEPRHYLQAWNFLRIAGQQPPAEIAKHLLGIVVEVGLEGGLDLLAAYPDHSARYYNYSGSGVVWEHPNDSVNDQIDALLAASVDVVAQIGRWDKARPPAPPVDRVRLNFLTPSGLHFGQAQLDVMSNDPIGGKVLYLAGQLMQALIAKSPARMSACLVQGWCGGETAAFAGPDSIPASRPFSPVRPDRRSHVERSHRWQGVVSGRAVDAGADSEVAGAHVGMMSSRLVPRRDRSIRRCGLHPRFEAVLTRQAQSCRMIPSVARCCIWPGS